jgi:hypothetical protein
VEKRFDDINNQLGSMQTLLEEISETVSHENAGEFPAIKRGNKNGVKKLAK